MASAHSGMIRKKLLKITGQICISVRKVRISFTTLYPWQELFLRVAANLQAALIKKTAAG